MRNFKRGKNSIDFYPCGIFVESDGPDPVELLQVDVALPPQADPVQDQGRVDVNLKQRKVQVKKTS